MKYLFQKAATALCIATALLLSSCIEVEQDIWIGEDGGGKAILKMGISKAMLEMAAGFGGGENDAADPFKIDELKRKLEANPNVISSKVSEDENEKFKYVIVDVDVKDITKVADLQEGMLPDGPGPAGGPDTGGDLEITRTDKGTYKFSAEFEAPGGAEAAMGAEMMKGMIGDAKMVLRVHAKPVSSDAHNGTADGGAVVWEIPLVDVLAGKAKSIEGEFKPGGMPGGGGLTLWLVIGVVIALAAVLFFIFQAQKPKLV